MDVAADDASAVDVQVGEDVLTLVRPVRNGIREQVAVPSTVVVQIPALLELERVVVLVDRRKGLRDADDLCLLAGGIRGPAACGEIGDTVLRGGYLFSGKQRAVSGAAVCASAGTVEQEQRSAASSNGITRSFFISYGCSL